MVKVLLLNNLNYRGFKQINLSFENKMFYTVIGCNNCGKTTLFKILSGLTPTSDIVTCDGIVLNSKTRKEFIKKIGVVERVDKDSFNYQSVLDEMIYPLNNLNYSKNTILKRIDDVLSFLDIMYIKEKSINDLNIYEKQKLLIAISLLHHPKVLLIDNVLNLFSDEEQSFIINKLNTLKEEQNLLIINFTSYLKEALLTDFIILLNNYKVIKMINSNEISKNDKLFYENNIEIPFLIDLNVKLKMYNIIKNNYDSMEDVVDNIWK